MQKLKSIDVATATGGFTVAGSNSASLTGVSIDSRTVLPGELFVALPGERVDGHAFVAQAVQHGAGGLLVSEAYVAHSGALPDVPTVAVPDTYIALQALAKWYRARFLGPVVAVTGSNGKTTTKDFVASVLGQTRHVLATAGNLNTEIGLSLTLLRRDPQHEAIVVEMGMRGLGQIAKLANIAQPTIGIITNVGPVHLELLGSLGAIARAKQELVQGLAPDGIAILNADDPRTLGMAQHTTAQVVTFGIDNAADVVAEDVEMRGLAGVSFRIVHQGSSAEVVVPFLGRHNVSNALAAAAAGIACGLDLETIARGLTQARLSGMRMQVERLANDVVIINDAYNASPGSVGAALHVLAASTGRRIAVLGDMLELGPIAEEAHLKIGMACAQAGVDHLVTVGPLSRHMAQGARKAGMKAAQVIEVEDAESAVPFIQGIIAPGDVVLVKASRGMALERVVEALQA